MRLLLISALTLLTSCTYYNINYCSIHCCEQCNCEDLKVDSVNVTEFEKDSTNIEF